ncbi:hypothetical protein [Holophaga foetida]|uniref:hypothetical protein n=1 Tax=Holophaga foetida TaxID=35839 RepID=UPI00024750A7|nr:hypothetical protein [Holophaga foetida]
MKILFASILLGTGLLGAGGACLSPDKCLPCSRPIGDPVDAQIREAFAKQGIRVSDGEVQRIRPDVLLALKEARVHGLGNSKVDFAAVQIAQDLGLDSGPGSSTVRNLCAAIGYLMRIPQAPPLAWSTYFNETVNLWNQTGFMGLMGRHQFHPVKISWEDIGRDANSAWGDRISDVGIWVRKDEADPASACLALSVRRDSNYRDKVLMVPAERIRIHTQERGRTVEKTLPQRLRELGLASEHRDRNVIVSNQFAIVPVPARNMTGAWKPGTPPRAAFNFSIFPYGSTNFVITDVIEGSSEAIVGPGTHQMLFANIDGRKAPFTASRAEDRPDLLRMERDLKAKGMDVDVQRYYLIQIPLRRDARSIRLSNLGTPPLGRGKDCFGPPLPCPTTLYKSSAKACVEESSGLGRVAIGHGEAEGAYFAGAGYRGTRAEEPIRVTVVYFVTPKARITEADMQTFAKAFAQWDAQAVWGGSFVVK